MKKPIAIFTLVKNEDNNLPRWVEYYAREIGFEDMYILDHESDTPDSKAFLKMCKEILEINVTTVQCDEVFNHDWLLLKIYSMLMYLLDKYERVIYTDADELLIPRYTSLSGYLKHDLPDHVRATGYEMMGKDKWYRNTMFDKTLINSKEVAWAYGYHTAKPEVPADPDLLLVHLHKLDHNEAYNKNLRWAKHKWDQRARDNQYSIQNQVTTVEEFDKWFYDTRGEPITYIPEEIKEKIVT